MTLTVRIGILTFLHNDNYGSSLQAYALQKVLREMGAEAEHLDYIPSRAEKLRNLLCSGNSPKLLIDGIHKRLIRARMTDTKIKAASFVPFYATHMQLSPPCPTLRTLRSQAAQYDALLCGSDQIWSPTWLNPAYFLCFAREHQPRLAYAPSLGVKTLPSRRKQKRIAALLKDFSYLSVREEEGKKLLEMLLPEHSVTVLPDPVFLLKRENWLSLADIPHLKRPYLLCYFLGESPAYWERVESLRKKTRLQVVVIPHTWESFRKPYDLCGGLSPFEFLGYLAEAALICTDSFHGAALSITLQRNFRLFRRYRDDDPASRNSRIDQLLREFSLDDESEEIPWKSVNDHLTSLRWRGLNALQDMLEAIP